MAHVNILVRVPGADSEWWRVPHGFGRAYADSAEDQFKDPDPQVISDILSLVGYEVSAQAVAAWPFRKQIDALVWAGRTHLRASDNIVRVPARPDWMGEPWKGPKMGEGVFESPGGTVLS